MPSFGERLRHEREIRNTTIEQIALATGIGRGYLEALERNEFHALPGPAFGKLYIRAYAETLGFDPQPLIHDYDREQQLRPRASIEPSAAEAARPRRVGAAIARWREARMAERGKLQRGVVSSGAGAEKPSETGGQGPPDLPCPEARETPHDEAAKVAPRVPAEPVEASPPATSSRRVVVVVGLLVLGLSLGAAGISFGLFGPRTVTPWPRIQGEVPPPAQPAAEARPIRTAEPASPPPPAPALAGVTTERGRLAAPEFGVGRRIVGRRLEGRDERFAQGEVVRFWTRVVGGGPGESVRHVWLHEGRVVQSIRLALGGPDWRTHSSRTLRDAGQGAVELRDEAGRVLARATFTCVPAGPSAPHRRATPR
jgi:transcriptional regulator with XRE-family HTH domain